MNRETFLGLIEPERSLQTQSTRVGTMKIKSIEDGDTPVLEIDGHRLSGEGYRSLCNELVVSWDYASKVPADLMVPHFQRLHIKRNEDKNVNVLTRGDEIVGIASANERGTTHTNIAIFEEIEKATGHVTEVVTDRNDMWNSHFTMVSERAVQPRVGDTVRAGIEVFNSVIGASPTTISLVNYRLVCRNGMVSPSNIRTLNVRNSDTLETAIAGLWGESQGFLDAFAATVNTPVDNLEETLPALFDQMNVPRRTRRQILRRIALDRPDNLYDLTNHFTYVATHETRGAWARHQMQATSGELPVGLENCSNCHRPMLAHTTPN